MRASRVGRTAVPGRAWPRQDTRRSRIGRGPHGTRAKFGLKIGEALLGIAQLRRAPFVGDARVTFSGESDRHPFRDERAYGQQRQQKQYRPGLRRRPNPVMRVSVDVELRDEPLVASPRNGHIDLDQLTGPLVQERGAPCAYGMSAFSPMVEKTRLVIFRVLRKYSRRTEA